MAAVTIPTRMELKRLKGKLVTARRGHKLLKDKLDELMRRFLEQIKEAYRLRVSVDSELSKTGRLFLSARAAMSTAEVNAAMLLPGGAFEFEAKRQSLVSLKVWELKADEGAGAAQYPYGFAFTAFELDEAVRSVSGIAPKMLRLCALEAALDDMAAEIEKTRRRVNALEHIMIPELEAGIRYITMKLDENERATRIRLMKVKDLMLKEQHNKRHPEKPWY